MGVSLDNAFIEKVKMPIIRTYGALASDLGSLEGERMTNKDAIEITIDANYLTREGFPEADALIGAACDEYGYTKVLNFLTKRITL